MVMAATRLAASSLRAAASSARSLHEVRLAVDAAALPFAGELALAGTGQQRAQRLKQHTYSVYLQVCRHRV